MRLYGLRIFVALLTFAVGVAVGTLFAGLARKTDCGSRAAARAFVVKTSEPLLEAAPRQEVRPETAPCASSGDERKLIIGGILNGKAVSKPSPVYPPELRTTRVEGTVVVNVLVDEDGAVVQAEALSGPKALRDAAVEAARKAKFSPTRLSGCPVRVSGVVTYNFVLP
jgi:TonB family protein